MTRGKILSVHLGSELKQRWTDYCLEQKVKPSNAVRQVIWKLLSSKMPPAEGYEVIQEAPDIERRRVEIRLAISEYACIEELAARAGCSPNVWLVNLVRAHLTRTPQFGIRELQTLGESNLQLMAIGRNLNQIARWMNGNQGSAPPEVERIDELYRLITEHTGKVSRAIRANIDRWSIK